MHALHINKAIWRSNCNARYRLHCIIDHHILDTSFSPEPFAAILHLQHQKQQTILTLPEKPETTPQITPMGHWAPKHSSRFGSNERSARPGQCATRHLRKWTVWEVALSDFYFASKQFVLCTFELCTIQNYMFEWH